ncbi:hypothetical protein ID866_10962, partial [Astraeus odoratus]
PPNNPSITIHHTAFNDLITKEYQKGQYIGPFSHEYLEQIIGHFQSSPLTIIPKPGKPGCFRLIQNLSYPNAPGQDNPQLINSQVDSSSFPCTWGTFHTTCTLIASLPPGCQGATRDNTEAYKTVPLHPSQWPALIVCTGDHPPAFAVDTALCFGYGPSVGTYDTVQDTALDIMRGAGIGPIIAWVDDHLFIQLPQSKVNSCNSMCEDKARNILATRGKQIEGGQIWYKGTTLADGSFEEFAEDCSSQIRNFNPPIGLTTHEPCYSYSFKHINRVS